MLEQVITKVTICNKSHQINPKELTPKTEKTTGKAYT